MWNKETKQHVLSEQRTQVVDMTAERTPVEDKPESEVALLPLEERMELVGKRTHEEVDIAIVDRSPGKTSDAIRKMYAKALDSRGACADSEPLLCAHQVGTQGHQAGTETWCGGGNHDSCQVGYRVYPRDR